MFSIVVDLRGKHTTKFDSKEPSTYWSCLLMDKKKKIPLVLPYCRKKIEHETCTKKVNKDLTSYYFKICDFCKNKCGGQNLKLIVIIQASTLSLNLNYLV